MKNLPLKNKIFIALAVVLILVLAYFAGGKTAAKPSKLEIQTETAAVSAVLDNAEATTIISETLTEETTETVSETISEIISEAVSEKLTVKSTEELTEKPTASNTEQTEKAPETTTLQPAAKAEVRPEKTANTCTLSVNCATILDNIDMFDKNKLSLLPADGVVFAAKTVAFEDGESVFDVLLREMRANNIHMEFSKVPAYNSVYIEGINNIYEFDCGELSGWEYRVNGEHPRYGCDMYKLKDGDVVEWLYTCDLGRDIGDTYYDQ
ncbi:MAG: DUF4430 domain-containing protein [Firmicutes bacterium]|nr:DUF4430 domain-containing protein [Bacillota bacterium]